MYEPTHPQALGAQLVELIYGLKDGIGPTDMAEAMSALGAGMAASDELKEDTDAAVFDVIAGMSTAMALKKRNPVDPPVGG